MTDERGWWHRLRPMTRRGVRAGVAFVVMGLIAGVLGVLTASYTGSLGPHSADYSIQLNGEVRVDMGPLGALIVDSPMPLHLGADVLVKEIPVELSTPEADPVAGLTGDLSSYTQFLANPQAAIDDAAQGLITDALGRWVLLWTAMLVLVALGRLAAHGVLRDALRSAWARTGVPALSIALVVVAVAVPLIEVTRPSGGAGRTSAILAGTPLEEARITGRLATLVDHYGGFVVDAIDDNTAFYEAARTNLISAFEADPEPTGPTAPPDVADGDVEGQDDAGVEGGDAAGVEGSDAAGVEGSDAAGVEGDAAQEAAGGTGDLPGDAPADNEGDDAPTDAPTDEPLTEDAVTTSLLVSDLHCNVGMADVIGAAVTSSGADLVLNAGDTVMGGTSVESYCVNAFAAGIPDGTPVVVADGNHDSRTTTEQERTNGWIVVEGEPVEVAGLRILGDTDPTLTSLGAPTHPQRDETINSMGNRLAHRACELADDGQGVDLLMVHSPYAARQVLEAGCAPISLAGHLHREIGPRQLGWGIQWVLPSAAGAGHGTPTIGPLNNPAVMTVLRWDTETGLPLEYRHITVGTDTSVVLSEWLSLPEQPAEYTEVSVDQE
ncbi:metallophosphoesterase [Ruania halotolerans]|uniref:metallophosphoesterase n=1 Tax=Ruania halotolerans TaxID=2897773 RepID=UPI001E362757|nr:metallophosphoesterase [Ruania halotolerans]UFU04970.1 metallophosphoesterase [Ruania halotolerans]